jgi:Protein of unknown function (DUF1214)
MSHASTMRIMLVMVLATWFALMAPVNATEKGTATMESWNTFTDELKSLGDQMLAALPPHLHNDPQVEQELMRLLLQALASKTIDALASDPDHPVFVPWIGHTLNVFQPNADTIYKIASVSPEGVYRLRGKIGSLNLFKVGQFGSPTPEEVGAGAPVSPIAYNDFNALNIDADGRYDVILSQKRPEGYQGDWWPMDPKTVRLWVRQVAHDWSREIDPTISIERLDVAVPRSRPSASDLQRRFQDIPRLTGNMASYFVDHVEGLREDGYINRLKEFDLSQLGGFAGQFYYEGSYELNADEALIITTRVPDRCHYWSVILTNALFETTDWTNNHSSLNGSQAQVDDDGLVRFVVSARDPGVPNWLDTAGHPIGVVQGRWTDCDSSPIPEAQKVQFSEVRQLLPDTTTLSPEQREHIIRERRAQFQQRPVW